MNTIWPKIASLPQKQTVSEAMKQLWPNAVPDTVRDSNATQVSLEIKHGSRG